MDACVRYRVCKLADDRGLIKRPAFVSFFMSILSNHHSASTSVSRHTSVTTIGYFPRALSKKIDWYFKMMKKTILKIMTLVTGVVAFSVSATNCPEHYFNGKEPILVAPMQQDQELCFTSFATAYSYSSRAAVYSAEHLSKDNLKRARKLKRVDSFHEESQLPEQARARLQDYKGSGFDRGHLAPNADMPNKKAQFESFSLANMVPQLHQNNAGIWSNIEKHVRLMGQKYGEVYVVTGGMYDASTQKLKGRIQVPNALFKAVYVPLLNKAGVYISDNNTSETYHLISVAQFRKRSGIDVFPSLAADVKNSVPNFPQIH